MKDNELLFDRKSHVLYSKPCKKETQVNTCVNGCRCDYTICGDRDPYVKEHPEYRDEAGFRRNK
jgi:hypothetical protein